MGSVKDLITEGIGGNLYIPPEPRKFGRGAWKVSGRFSVADLKGLIPSEFEIKEKNFVLAMTAGAYFEDAAEHGIDSCYLGMMNKDGNIVAVKDLLDVGELSDVIVMKLANTPKSGSNADVEAYHQAIRKREITVYVADVESIFRAGLPLGSSVFKKICGMMGKADMYEQAATYDQTVSLLDEIRGELTGMAMPEDVAKYISTLGLECIPNPGKMLPKPVFNYTTKFAETGDTDINEAEVILRLGGDETAYSSWRDRLARCSDHQINYARQRGFSNMDGKVENVGLKLTDFACTVDENRLMLLYEKDGVHYLVPSNKEIQRAIFRKNGIYTAIEEAKKTDKENWKDHIFEFTTRAALIEAAEVSVGMMGDAIGTIGNLALGKTIFTAKPIDQWVGPFLPYASRVQK